MNVDNSIPEVKVGSPVVVAEGGSMVVPAASIIASDLDTPLSKLEVVLDSQPEFGYINNKDAGKLFHVAVDGGGKFRMNKVVKEE